MKTLGCLSWLLLIGTFAANAAEVPRLNERAFEERMGGINREPSDTKKLHRARELAGAYYLSSLQVKAIASRLPDESSRLAFALEAYPRTVDPENFYEVYDAFTSFSKVMRLHDGIHRMGKPMMPVVIPAVLPMPQPELEQMTHALKKEAFDKTRLDMARQMLVSAGRRFLSEQVKQMARCFDFESNRLEFARLAYDYTLDREKYFVMNEVFDFESSRRDLSRHVQSRTKAEAEAK